MKARGFTLLELLVAMVITLLIAGLLLAVTTNLLTHMRRSQGSSTAGIEARLVLDQLERDFHSAMIRPGGAAWLDVSIPDPGNLASHGWTIQSTPPMKPTTESLRLVPVAGNGMPVIADARFGRSGVWLRMITSDYDSAAGATLPVAVAYQVVRQPVSPTAGAPVRYALSREKMSAADTFNLPGSLFAATAPADLVQPNGGDVIASNVVDFGLWFHSRDSAGQLTRLFPSTQVAPTHIRFPAGGRPMVVDLLVRILTDEGAARIQAIEEGRVELAANQTPGEAWWAEAMAHSHVFTRRVEIKGVIP